MVYKPTNITGGPHPVVIYHNFGETVSTIPVGLAVQASPFESFFYQAPQTDAVIPCNSYACFVWTYSWTDS